MEGSFEYQTYKIVYRTQSDTSMREGTAYFDIQRPDRGLFYVDVSVSEMAAAQFWKGRDKEVVAVELGNGFVRQLADNGNFSGQPDPTQQHLKYYIRYEPYTASAL